MIGAHFFTSIVRRLGRTHPGEVTEQRAHLQDGWVLANHILVSFHAAFISSVLVLPSLAVSKEEVLRFIFVSPETVVSVFFVYISFHVGIAIHEIGHFLTAARLNALNDSIAEEVGGNLLRRGVQRWLYLGKLFVLAPWGRATGIKRQGLNYYPDAPFNLAVAAAGPRSSRNLAYATLPLAILLLGIGLRTSAIPAIYVGRLLLGIGIVGLLDFLIADRGKYREFQQRERKARDAAATLPPVTGWLAQAAQAKQRLVESRMQEVIHPRLGPVTAPWQFRNCGMGGRHTEKEYPESNVSMQEAMFLILGARDYLDAQEMTVGLQTRLKEIIENAEGCRVMGIGLEGGLAPYIDRGEYPLPEVRLWAMMKQAIEECGYRPGEEVAIALDPAMSELEIAYREEFGVPDSVGTYLFWRDESKTVLDRDGVLQLYDRALREFEIPVLSIEDGFSEEDHEGWKQLNESLGERLLIIGDDLITTNDAAIEDAADHGLVNSALIKANQIGTLHETVLATLVALSKGLTLVISHRSKSPNDDMEAHIALATNALGLKCGGGANTERLIKYHSVATQMALVDRGEAPTGAVDGSAVIVDLSAAEEPTNAGVPTVGVEVDIHIPKGDVRLGFRGATPLGTSAGTGEAFHLVDGAFESAEHAECVETHRALLDEVEAGVFAFRKGVTPEQVREIGDDNLVDLFARTRRYEGKGCLNAVDNVREVIAPYFRGRDLASASFLDLDRALLQLERHTAVRRGKLEADASSDEVVAVMQRKQNLGMNAVLSASLAITRAIAHVNGKQLWELMREEMLIIIERLASKHGVSIDVVRWEDYVAALRQVAVVLEGNGAKLHTELRQLTGVYDDPLLATPSSLQTQRSSHSGDGLDLATSGAVESGIAAVDISQARPSVGAETALTELQHRAVREVSEALYRSYAKNAEPEQLRIALRQYLRVRTETRKTLRPFEIVNDKIIRTEDRVLVPYLAGDDLLVHDVRAGEVTVTRQPLRTGTIVTDELLAEMTGVRGDVIDFDDELYGYALDAIPEIRISRIRDMAAMLKELGASANYYGAAIYLRGIVMRLCGHSFRGFLEAKNLRSEVHQLNAEIVKVLDCPFADRLRLAMRILVRKVSGLLLRPSLIDQLWNDAIDLSEVHVRSSRIANELRRSSHHALGKPTLELAAAYHEYLQTGNVEHLTALGFAEVSATDEAARQKSEPRALVERIVHCLEKLLGSAQIVTRIREWQDVYAEALVRCEFGESLDEELETIVNGGIRATNRWVFGHHLRIIGKKIEEVAAMLGDTEYASELNALEQLDPADGDFDAQRAEEVMRNVVTSLTGTLRERCQEPLFRSLDEALAAFEGDEFLETVRLLAQLRADIESLVEAGGFPDQRYLLYQLDCLLEEMGYLAMRHIASSYQRDGVRLDGCFEILVTSARNLAHGGLQSYELCELASMLGSSSRSDDELLNILEALQQARLPLLSAHQRHFHDTLRKLQLPKQIELQPPPYFEGDSYRVSFAFNSRQQLRQVAQRLSAAAAHDGLDDLLALL
jgi:enolase